MTNIKNICKDVSFNRVYNWNNMPKRILHNVLNSLEIEENELVLFYDSSVFETGKTGIAICEDGIYWKDMSSPTRFLSWNKFIDMNISKDDYHIYIGDKEGIFVYHRDLGLLIEMLENLKKDIKANTIVMF